MNSFNNKNHNNNRNKNNYFYNKAASIYAGFDLIVISLVNSIINLRNHRNTEDNFMIISLMVRNRHFPTKQRNKSIFNKQQFVWAKSLKLNLFIKNCRPYYLNLNLNQNQTDPYQSNTYLAY